MSLLELLFPSLATTLLGSASVLHSATQYAPRSAHVVHQFPAGTWIENLAVRSNGKILATDDINALLCQVDPINDSLAVVVHDYDCIAAITGIAEADEDVFLVSSSNYSSANLAGYGQFFIFRVDLRHHPAAKAKVTKVAEVPQAGILNCLTYIAESNIVLVSDSFEGVVWSVDMDTGAVAVAMNNTYTRYPGGFGVNSVKALGNDLYFSATSKELFARGTINSKGQAVGDAEVLANGGFGPDDFAVDRVGNTYITSFTKGDNGVGYVPTDGGNWNKIASVKGPTSAAFGRTTDDCHILYVGTTGGDYKTAANGTFIGAGTITGIDLGSQAKSECREYLSQLAWIGAVGHK